MGQVFKHCSQNIFIIFVHFFSPYGWALVLVCQVPLKNYIGNFLKKLTYSRINFGGNVQFCEYWLVQIRVGTAPAGICSTFINPVTVRPSSSRSSYHPLSILCHYNFVFLRILYAWNRIGDIALWDRSLSQHGAFEIHPSSWVCFLHCKVISHGKNDSSLFILPCWRTLKMFAVRGHSEERVILNTHVQTFMWT